MFAKQAFCVFVSANQCEINFVNYTGSGFYKFFVRPELFIFCTEQGRDRVEFLSFIPFRKGYCQKYFLMVGRSVEFRDVAPGDISVPWGHQSVTRKLHFLIVENTKSQTL